MLRTVVERVSRGVAFRRRLPAAVGGLSLYVSPDSQLKYLKLGDTAFDIALLQVATTQVRRDAVIWDVGANVGVFTFAAAGLAPQGKVLAVEADPWLAGLLRKSAGLPGNRGSNVSIICAAIADRSGVSEFVIARRGRASNYLADAGGWTQAGGERERVHVPTLTLDSLLESLGPPNFVKIDIEGAELLALKGATRLLDEARPALYIEVGSTHATEVSRILTEARYRIFDSRQPLERQSPLARCVLDTLALPS